VTENHLPTFHNTLQARDKKLPVILSQSALFKQWMRLLYESSSLVFKKIGTRKLVTDISFYILMNYEARITLEFAHSISYNKDVNLLPTKHSFFIHFCTHEGHEAVTRLTIGNVQSLDSQPVQVKE
jgi:hypothetical protein